VSDAVDRWAWETAVLASELKGGIVKTAWAVRSFANDKGGIYPSQATVARRRNCADRTVRRHLDKLEQLGFIKRLKGQGKVGRGGVTDLIVLCIPQSADTHAVRTSDEHVTLADSQSADTHTVRTSDASESADTVKVRTTRDRSADTKPESADNQDPKCGQSSVRQTMNQYLNQEPFCAPDGARLSKTEEEEKMANHDGKTANGNQANQDRPSGDEFGRESMERIRILARTYCVHRGPNESDAEFRDRVLDAHHRR